MKRIAIRLAAAASLALAAGAAQADYYFCHPTHVAYGAHKGAGNAHPNVPKSGGLFGYVRVIAVSGEYHWVRADYIRRVCVQPRRVLGHGHVPAPPPAGHYQAGHAHW